MQLEHTRLMFLFLINIIFSSYFSHDDFECIVYFGDSLMVPPVSCKCLQDIKRSIIYVCFLLRTKLHLFMTPFKLYIWR